MFNFLKSAENSSINSSVVKNPAEIDHFLSRGVENIFPNADFVRAKMLRGERLTMYLGIDPTGPTLHLGHVIPLRKMAEFQKLGHQVILLIGDFTGMIGDPTDKSATRKKLTHEQVKENSRLYKEQASRFISFSGENAAKIKYNSEWLGKMNFGDVLELASNITVQQMLKRDMFAERMKKEEPIHLHEFLYPLMQGYDSVAMDVDGEIGGNDQTFNMLAGRDLMKVLKNKEKFVIGMRLLTDPSGKKMGKTENNAVSLDQSPEDMFGRVMSWPDTLIVPGFEICTDLSQEEIKKIADSIAGAAGAAGGANPRDAKIRLAKEIVAMCNGNEEQGRRIADQAAAHFENTFRKGEIPEDTKEVSVDNGAKLVDVLLNATLIESKSDFRRLIEGKGISEVGKDLIEDVDYKLTRDISLRIGKKRFLKVKVK